MEDNSLPNHLNAANIDITDPATLNFEPFQPQVAHPSKPQVELNSKSSTSLFTITYYQKYFQVSSIDVQRRILKAFKIFGEDNFLDSEASGAPELWGPLWIAISLAILLFTTSVLAGELGGSIKAGSIDFSLLSLSFLLFFGYLLVESAAMVVFIKSMNESLYESFDYMAVAMLIAYSWIFLLPTLVSLLVLMSSRSCPLFPFGSSG